MTEASPDDHISAALVEEELKTLVQFVERHHRWTKTSENAGVARLNMVVLESLIEASELIRTLCAKLRT